MVNIQLSLCQTGTFVWSPVDAGPGRHLTVPEMDKAGRFTGRGCTAIPAAMPRIKLSQKQRLALIAEYRAGARIDFLAAKYGVHRSYPRQLFKRQAKEAERLPKAA